MRWWIAVAIACGASACGSKKPPEDPAHTPAGAKPCEQMADHLVTLMDPDPEVKDTADKVRRTLVDTCVNDKWTLDAQRCFLGLGKLAEADRCATLLTVEQRDKADQAMKAAFEPAAEGNNAP